MTILAGQRIRALDFAGYAQVFDGGNVNAVAAALNGWTTVSPVLGVSFMAPTGGAVKVEWGGRLHVNSPADRAYCGCDLRTGAVIGSGVVVDTASTDISYEIGGGGGTTVAQGTGSNFRVHTGLTAGSLYHFVWLVGRGGTGGTVDVLSRFIAVTPWLGG